MGSSSGGRRAVTRTDAASPRERRVEGNSFDTTLVDRPRSRTERTVGSVPASGGRATVVAPQGGTELPPLSRQSTPNDNGDPRVMILQPADGVFFVEGQPVELTGIARTDEGQDLSDQLVWSADGKHQRETGNLFRCAFPVGAHVIQASVSDGKGARGFDELEIQVIAAPRF